METVKRLEIIINSLELQPVLKILESVGISGYTVIENVMGAGDRGRVINDLESSALSNVYILSVCNPTQETAVVPLIRPMLKKYGGICIISDAKSIMH